MDLPVCGTTPEVFEETVTQSVVGDQLPPLLRDVCTITVLAGSQRGAVFTLDDDEDLVFGRGNVDAQIDDAGLSRNHARVFRKGDKVYIQDLSSTNGTFCEGKRVIKSMALNSGDRILLGKNVVLRFTMQDPLEQRLAEELYLWTVKDPLTGIHNRRHLIDRLAGEYAFAIRHKSPLSLLIIDVDEFKQLNDTMGHRAGDALLSVIARFLERIVRTEDLAARYGGDEFVLVLRAIQHESAMTVAHRIRQSIEALSVPWEDGQIAATISIGVATLSSSTHYEGPDELLEAADKALYRAKADGRNRVRDEPRVATQKHN
jgi:diguanylate cyclase (GGDEF)-like protein